jgi:hypothetical protein
MRIANKLFLLLAIIFINNCASVSAPQGGEIDAISPGLVSTTPKILTEINPTQKITIQFNEYLQETSLKKAIKIFPTGDYDFKYEYKGDEIDFWIPSNLDTDTTYLLVFDTKLKDEHGVNITQDIVIPFSRDFVFHSGTIKGNIFGDFNTAFILLWLNNPSKAIMFDTPPDYILRASSTGGYQFNFLPNADFSIVAVQQYGSNIDYTKEAFSFYRKNKLSLHNDLLSNINFYLTRPTKKEDSVVSSDSLTVDDTDKKALVKTATILGSVKGNFLHPINVFLKNTKDNYTNAVELGGNYTIDEVLEGKYQLLIYEDRNNDLILNMGSFTDEQFAERFYVYPDSLILRANWELEIPMWNYSLEKEE